MTAEIAILNRTAVALAADSVVTLSDGRRRKTYDSAEKIFELSRFQPIALMIYNNAQFMNTPLEVIIREYREGLTTNTFKSLVQVWPEFEKYLLSFKRGEDDERDHLRGMVLYEVGEIKSKVLTHILSSIGKRSRKASESVPDFIVRQCELRKVDDERRPLKGYLSDVTSEKFREVYGDAVIEVATRTKLEMSAEVETALCDMMFAIIRSTERSEAFTGLVFTGFGTEEIFPTLNSVEIDGVYFNQFRVFSKDLIDIDRRGDTAAIVPFAQQDMPQRFMLGIDGEFESAVENLCMSMVGEIVDQNSRAFRNGKAALIKDAVSEKFRVGLDRIKKKNLNELLSVVNHLSKKELGEVAYSLVELTSRKRRYSNDLETVGGPIDVAILTKNEGFIWVRRKHYFDVALNPRYDAKRNR
ncbi:hypothetical protein LAV84_23615 [Rhizobium sp. VS19-DR104.2]|uniref:hypothetical protein n=1 Tax=unclassified Rhizobium TaxID=2613769 RepID=UPI001CC47D75|nr:MULTISPECIES: hypothetical protein [unclassified Rhizobium]MBZ5762249.1 hypothetical protein [Rhizobium sp. VS19-DR96]MBZ5768265.1 hypothetical protein [Rhizobium sp. VS19-DR129.2]MBZ5775863.1 hypothetical protein [Rhizobium sp. VS19-DRK62.2]MBZ5787116.1 hypothetical protein [Rhizobium sp. VS19-DR121]MBZ5804190.1 hypothetical protein [Rhizobium sp. VS19-DR181]